MSNGASPFVLRDSARSALRMGKANQEHTWFTSLESWFSRRVLRHSGGSARRVSSGGSFGDYSG
jgi:hypothetical protein